MSSWVKENASKAAAALGVQLDVTTKLSFYRQMVLIRRFEELSRIAYQQGKIAGFLHLYIGEEAIAVGAIAALRSEDHLLTHYRDHGHAIARGMDPRILMAELFGKVTGCSRGRGGSMHFASLEHNYWGGHAIVGGHLPMAVGLAFAAKYLGEPRVTMVIFGDAATDIGEFYESLNMAALWKTPTVFLCENNLYGMGVAIEKASAVTEIYRKACMANIPAERIDGMDVLAVHEAAVRAVEWARAGNGPYFLEAVCYRFQGHSIADPELYRTKEEVERWKQRDPIQRFRQHLIEVEGVSEAQLETIHMEVEQEMEAVMRFAEESPDPPLEELYDFVYANPVGAWRGDERFLREWDSA
ncbi:MAG: pyruvate dehydrogenase (acetyl-transferring) E1 component subunit alpha [Anaerolineae bacterium]|nr:pyruvate dehydrogenase (acetyl-transferring) E1 component subunit alpha [Thermoflexus sp.]MDW8064421.1 pyruvate dehydrogenase (acetyl-transferring) E1 component subunit alpha [Anaerolineae bacterium]